MATAHNIALDLWMYVPMEVWTYGSKEIDGSSVKEWQKGRVTRSELE
jgi:hypothetical protein